MDKTVNVRLFRVERREIIGLTFSEGLRAIAALCLSSREHEIEPDLTIRLEQLDSVRGLICGEIIRMQSINLPSKALSGQPLESLGVESIGHSTAFAYEPNVGILALQMARNGITSTRVAIYVETLAGSHGFDILPIPSREIWNKLVSGRVRALKIRVADPEALRAADGNAQTVVDGLRYLKAALGTHHVEVKFSVGRADGDIDRRSALSIFGWLRRQREDNRGGVSRLDASVILEDESRSEWLNLIDGQVGEKKMLDLPSDNPSRSFNARRAFCESVLRQHLSELTERFSQ